MSDSAENKGQMQRLNEAYKGAHEIHLHYKKEPGKKTLERQFTGACKEYTKLLKKYKISFAWAYNNHFGLWEYHPAWQKLVIHIIKGLKKAKTIEMKLHFLNDLKTRFLNNKTERGALNEKTGLTLAKIFISSKLDQLTNLKETKNPDKKIAGKIERNISENMSYYETIGSVEGDGAEQGTTESKVKGQSHKAIHEYDINTGAIFQGLYIRRVKQDKIFADTNTFFEIKEKLMWILREHSIVSQKWEDMAEEKRAEYQQTEETTDTFFLNHHTHVLGYSKNEPYSFDVTYFKEPFVLHYKKDEANGNKDFRMFFTLKIAITDVSKMENFLNYQLSKNFKEDKELYAKFLEESLFANEHLISETGKITKGRSYIEQLASSNKTGNLRTEKQMNAASIPEGLKFKTPIKEYTQKEIRGLYDMNEKLFRSYMEDYKQEIGKLGKSRKYTIKQVYGIFHFLGDPALKKNL